MGNSSMEFGTVNFELVALFEVAPVLHTSVRKPCGHTCLW